MPESLSKINNHYSIGFYNLENLFDTVDDPKKLDDDFTASSDRQWSKKRLERKVRKLGQVISALGFEEIGHPPVLLGVAEVENARVLNELVDSEFLKKLEYDFVHIDSPDERGIDTALLFRKDYFSVEEKEAHTLLLYNEEGIRDFTRDVLYIKGKLQGETLHLLVNHWPSRRQGTLETDYKRMMAAKKNLEIIQRLQAENPNARIIVMGDFNDDPHSESIQHLVADSLYNPMELLLTKSEGTTSYKQSWHLFDQIIMTHNFLKGHGNSMRFKNASIFNPRNLQEYEGKYKGLPFRTYAGKKHLGGFSDHFPIYAVFSMH